MQQPTRLISTPFAQEGEKTEIQNVTGEFDNSATYQLGFPPLTMQSIRLGGKPPKGTDFNGILFDITENISFLCKGGRYQYNAGLSTLIGGYPEGSNLLLDDNVTEVVSTVAGNQNNPNTDMTGWILKPNRTTAEYVLDASGETQQQVNYNGGSKWHSRVGGYQENERVVLTNGDIVKSTIDGNANDPNVNMTGWVNESNAVKNRIVWFEDFVSDVTGVADVTAEMQALLDSHDGDIYAKSTSVFKTSNTLFNRKHNRTIDFHNAKIINKSNSRYAIVTISPAFTGSTESELSTFSTERHYGQEVKFSHVANLRYEMSASTGGGNNLGVGIVYGYKCKLSRMFPIMTNGNGVEIRNSLRCGLYNSEIQGHRNYTCFVFMSQRCEIIGNKFKNGARGVCTKMNRDGDSYCGHIIAFNTFEDATNNGRAIIGGEWRETVLTHEIYVDGHEWVDGNLIYGNTFNNIAQPQTISAACFGRGWKVYDNIFKWNNLNATVFNAGGEGNVIAGETLTGGHEFYDNEIYDYLGEASAMITARLPTKVYKNKYFNCRAKYWLLSQIDVAGNKLEYAEYANNELIGDQNAVYCHNAGEHGFVATADVKNFVFKGNSGLLKCLQNATHVYATTVSSSADTTDLSGGDFQVSASAGVTGITAAIVYRGAIRNLTGRKISVSAPTTAIGLQLQSGVTIDSKHESNVYVLNGSATTARAVVNNTDFVDGVNTYSGAWTTRIFNNFAQHVALLNIDRQSLSIPTTGSYKKGDFVRNTNPLIVSNSVVFGWLRITTGSNHVLNTDWIAIKQSTV